jgi:hypothetical protein
MAIRCNLSIVLGGVDFSVKLAYELRVLQVVGLGDKVGVADQVGCGGVDVGYCFAAAGSVSLGESMCLA